MGGADSNRQASGHHAVGAQHADRKIGNVHGATLARIETTGLAEQLAHHALHVGTLGQRVAVATVCRGEVIVAA